MPLVVKDVANHGQWWQHKGIWGVVISMVEEEEVGAIILVCQVPIHPGVDDGGKRSSMTPVGLRGSQHQAGEGGGGGAREGAGDNNNGYRKGGGGGGDGGGGGHGGGGGGEGEEVCLAVHNIVISIININNN
jgi:hypothetical protein